MSLPNSSKPLVHIAHDEKFIDAAYDIYEKAFPKKNKFFILVDDKKKPFKHLNEEKNYHAIERNNYLNKEFIQEVSKAVIVVFHSLAFDMAKLSFELPEELKKIWTVFGFETYVNTLIDTPKVYGKRTYKELYSYKGRIEKTAKKFYFKFFKRGKNSESLLIKRSMQQMDYVALLIDEEFDLFKKLNLVSQNSSLLKFTYYPMDLIIDEGQKIKGNNILIGNSAKPTNNHLEVFDLLDSIDIANRKIITPLSYGSEIYARKIIEEGEMKFGNLFYPLTDFLPLKEYQQILQSCEIVIMNHYRQQAVGNILNSLYMGATVYLSNKNTVFHYLKRIGCYIYCIESDIVSTNNVEFNLLDNSQIEHNRKILKEELSLERLCFELQQKINITIKR